jgi:hypothetical protein
MDLKIAKWRDNCSSPVLFKIDDLANIYIKKSSSKNLEIGEDWGQCAFDKNSMWDFLSKNLLNKYPHIKTTFFLVTKERASITQDTHYTYNRAMDGDKKFIDFLKYLHQNPKVELSYHGTTHGKTGKNVEDFQQEWETFQTLNEAITTISEGKELFKSLLGDYPTGGKYSGYKEGNFGKDSIAQSGFKWWCYHEDNLMWDKSPIDKKYTYDLEFIQGVVNIPTTVDASNLSLKIVNKFFTRKYLKSIYLYLTEGKTVEKHIKSLLKNKEVVSVYEHTSPYMTNNTIQYPNIISDIDNLNLIFALLEKEHVWYATCNEVANYFIDRQNTKIEVNENSFKLLSNKDLNSEITLTLPYKGGVLSLYNDQNQFIKTFRLSKEELYITYAFKINKLYKIKNLSEN